MLRDEEHSFVRQLLAQHTGVAFDDQQRHLVASRLSSLARRQNLSGPGALIDALRTSPTGPLLDSVIEALTIHETSFFRDQQAFAALSDRILPDLVKQRASRRSLSIWSAACSTGQEAYSLAMLLHERFPHLGEWRVSIWATDVSRAVIRKARDGRFSERELQRGVTAQVRDKYFERSGEDWQARDFLRHAVRFDTFNLNATWPPMGSFDLILLRNVLIYFSGEARALIFDQAAKHLTDDGYLLLGASETTFGACNSLLPEFLSSATAYRKPRR